MYPNFAYDFNSRQGFLKIHVAYKLKLKPNDKA